MIRKRLIIVLHSFCLSLLLIGSVAYYNLENFIVFDYATNSMKQFATSFFIPLRDALVVKDHGKLSALTNKMLISDSTLLMVKVTDNSGKEFQAERRSDQVRGLELKKLNTIDLTHFDINEFNGVLEEKMVPRRNEITVINRGFSDIHGNIGNIRLVFYPGASLNSLLNNIIFSGVGFFLVVYLICFIIFSTVNRSLKNYYSLLKQITNIDYNALGITPPELTPKGDDASNISQTFSILVEEVKKSYAELTEQNYQLKSSKELFKSFMDSMSEAVLIRDRYRNVVYANDALKKLLSIDGDFIGKKIDRYLPPRLQAIDFDSDMEIVQDVTFLNRRVNFADRIFDLKKFCAISGRNQLIVATVIREITAEVHANKEKAHFQRRMFISSKLASLGVLASGVAHEMYNPLTVIIGNLDLLKRENSQSERSLQKIERMNLAADKMKDFVDRLRALDRPASERKFKKVLMNDIIDSSSGLLSSTMMTSNIKVELNLAENLPHFFGDKSLIENALINLFINAREAFENSPKGELQQVIAIKTMLSPAGNICVEFSDNACGIPKKIQDKLFDPLFTTNEVKKTGLGLSLVREIISQHDGDLFFFSSEGQGTTFKFFIPQYKIENDMTDDVRPRPRGRDLSQGEITVLLVHKQTDFGEVVRDFLMGHYNVISCTDINEVDEGIAKSCDFGFGECSGDPKEGIKLVETLRKLSTDLPFVVMGKNLDDESLKRDLCKKGASEVISRDVSELEQLHELIAKHLS